MPRVGAHVSGSGGLLKAVARGQAIGAECLQIFISSPLQWQQVSYTKEQMSAFKKAVSEADLLPVFFHCIYLINLASEKPELVKKSKESLIYYLNHVVPLGASGAIFHTGSHKGLGYEQAAEQVARTIKEILRASDPKSILVIENSAGSGGTIGSKFAEIGDILRRVNDSRLKVCIDTQHSFVSGYNWRDSKSYEATLLELEKEIGFDRIVAIHSNDSKVPYDSHRDRHENIGQGEIGEGVFKKLLRDRRLADIPFILEVPGLDGHGPDEANMAILKRLRA